jgi:DNA-binding XRE family transcriptional regulator
MPPKKKSIPQSDGNKDCFRFCKLNRCCCKMKSAPLDPGKIVRNTEFFNIDGVAFIVRIYRNREVLSQEQLAFLLGIPTAHVAEIERNERRISKTLAKKLAQALNTGPEMFLLD